MSRTPSKAPRRPAQPAREALIGALFLEFRQMSTGAIMFHQAIADRLGLHPTDHKCADLILRNGPLTPGRLAELTGLTTGAITGVVDRLVEHGMARRVMDPHDRRRVIVEVVMNADMQREMASLFQGIADASRKLLDGYTDGELALILDFVRRSNALSHEETLKLRAAETAVRSHPTRS